MADNFVGEIRAVSFNFPPVGWATCSGQIMSISQNTALFSLLGTTYGGNGQTTFALPDLQGRVAISQGQGPGLTLRDLGEEGGEESLTLLVSEIPSHRHKMSAADVTGTTDDPTQGVYAKPNLDARLDNLYATSTNVIAAPDILTNTGGDQPHENRQPYLCLLYIIALQGIFPSRN
jgi:microcystin-dependent protein